MLADASSEPTLVDWSLTREQDVLRLALEREIVAPINDPRAFYRHAHEIIWATVLELKAAGRTCDYLTVRAELERRGQLEVVGAVYLHELARDSVTLSNAAIQSAADEILQAHRTRQLRALLGRHAAAPEINRAALAADLARFDEAASTPIPFDLEDAVDVAAEGMALEAQGVPYLVDGILPALGMLGFLVAFAKVGKTTFGQALAAHVATGADFLARATRAARVLILAAEDPAEYTAFLARRLQVPSRVLMFRRRPLILTSDALDQICATVRHEGFGLVLIASWQAVVRGLIENENDNAGAVQIVERVKVAARASGVPWLIDAHSGKGEDQDDDADPSKAMRGASAAAGAADYTLSLRYGNGTFGTERRLSGKGRFVSFAPIVMDFDPMTGTYTVKGSTKDVIRESTWRLIDESGALDAEPRGIAEIARRMGLVTDGERITGTHRRQILTALQGRQDVGLEHRSVRGQKTAFYRRLELS
jgi:hypothetical protein